MNGTDSPDRFAVWVTTGLGVGLVSPAPGTVGGLWGLPLAWGVVQLPGVGIQVAVIVLIGATSAALCTSAARSLGSLKDPGAIVLDEIVALPIVYLFVETGGLGVWLTGWILFRFFDIAKPPPVRQFEKLPAGWGIMADDWVAAVMAGVALRGLLWIDRAMNWAMLTSSA